ncbi:putative DegT/DnrJ/EryC1/StrS aminotransferase [gamma proteobacterium IMCC1989]|nr:putative DegT/DnrJ/EryC1/StrS aminotransferase [gamma proteobacterium IMCC1989]
MIPYGRQDITQQDIDSVIEVLQSDFITQGPKVPAFEEALATYCNTQHGIATNSATSALHIACIALGLKQGDHAWTTPITFVASANCILYCGAHIDFVDINPETYNLCPNALEEKLQKAKQDGCLPKVIIAVHLCGQSCDMKAIYKLSQEYGFKIIEDASHAIGGSYEGKPIGNCQYSDITIFSFHPVKIITTAEGGIALTNSLELKERMVRYRSHGITTNQEIMETRTDEEIWNYQQIDIGFNYRMTDLQAALGLSQLERLDEYINIRHDIANKYQQLLDKTPIILPKQKTNTRSSFHLYPIRIRQSLCGKDQKQIYNKLREASIGVNLHYIPVYLQPYYEKFGFKRGYCPNAEAYFREAISIPMYPTLAEDQQRTIVNELHKALR